MDTRDLAAWLGERLDRIEAKMDGVNEHCGRIDVTLAGQAKDIAHHISRTDALEQRVEQVASDLKPVKDHVARLKGGAAVLGLLATTLGVLRYLGLV